MFKRILLMTLLLLLIGAAFGSFYLWRSVQTGAFQQAVVTKVAEQFIAEPIPAELISNLLGIGQPRTYLVLLLNNTELRPGGGFIGAYAVVRVEKGKPKILKVEGTEIIDNYAAPDSSFTPPAPIAKYLLTKRWQFRDSNWSPDFKRATEQALILYARERGVEAKNIDAVIAFTPTVMERLLKIVGPLEVQGETFTSENFTEKVEYEVEYNYAKRGITFNDRKRLLSQLGDVLLRKLEIDVFKHWSDYEALMPALLEEKHIAFYSLHPSEQTFIEAKDWGGLMKLSSADYILWADANLGALKTDAVMDRNLTYSFVPTSSTYQATVTMNFFNHGRFDWRTSRYRNYVRVFVPLGSTLIRATGAMDNDRSTRPGTVDQGVENGRQWFGAFISVEPGARGSLSFEYYLSPTVVTAIKNNKYELVVQKQIGTAAVPLTLGLDFGKKVTSATPPETPDKYGDNRYDVSTDLRVDRKLVTVLQ